MGLERAHKGPAARAPGRLPGAVDPLHRLRPAHARRGLPLLLRRRPWPRVPRRHGRALHHLLRIAGASSGLGRRALAARRLRARGRMAQLDPREGARPAARPAARRDAQPRGHLRLGPGLRAARDAAARLAPAGGPRLRRDDPRRAREDHPQLRRAHRQPRARRRLDQLDGGAPRGHRRPSQRAWASTPASPPTRPRSSSRASTATRATCWRRACTRAPAPARRPSPSASPRSIPSSAAS